MVLSFINPDELFNVYLPNTGGNTDKPSTLEVVFVDKIYRQEEQLLKSAINYNPTLYTPLATEIMNTFKAKFESCDRIDCHYRMPGIPDHTILTWFGFIATSMKEGFQLRGNVKYWES